MEKARILLEDAGLSRLVVLYREAYEEHDTVVDQKPARGIATNGYGANLQSTVAVYIDELPISTIGNTTVLDPNLYDVERIEFLRGPQGTLFGSGSLSGALRILTKSPDLTSFDASSMPYRRTSDRTARPDSFMYVSGKAKTTRGASVPGGPKRASATG